MGFNADGTWTPDNPLGITIGSPVKANNAQFVTGVNTDANAVASGNVPEKVAANSVVLNNGGGLAEQGWTDKIASWFRPDGEKGTSVGGNIMGAIGTGVNAATGLAGMYYAGKNYELAKDAAELEKKQAKQLLARQAKVDAAGVQLGNNVGNGASYNYMNTAR